MCWYIAHLVAVFKNYFEKPEPSVYTDLPKNHFIGYGIAVTTIQLSEMPSGYAKIFGILFLRLVWILSGKS